MSTNGPRTAITALIFGVVILVVGLALENAILTQASTAGSSSDIGSFSGAQDLNDLVPVLYNAAVVVMGVGLLALGSAGLMGRGPLRVD